MSNSLIFNEISTWQAEAINLRHQIHQHPEIGFHEVKTQQLIIEQLKLYGVDEINTQFAKTGVVAVIHGKQDGPIIGLRADIDALPITEKNTFNHKSQCTDTMHACGHDGHTIMLLMAAKYLCLHRNFSGKAVLIFQPAEEGLGGAKTMLADGLLTQYPIEAIYALHNMPHLAVGEFGFRTGSIMASSDRFYINIYGKGGHAALPHLTSDPMVTANAIYQAIQSFTARSFNPLQPVVISVTQMQCGQASNVIANEATMVGTFRTHNEDIRNQVIDGLQRIVANIPKAFGMQSDFALGQISHPPTVNHSEQVEIAINAAKRVSSTVITDVEPLMGSEDFSLFLKAVKGCYGFLGNGHQSAPLHNPHYDFNDEIIPYGATYFVEIIHSYHKE